jgi:glycosyltransferase involved in cell wall biosynthesis
MTLKVLYLHRSKKFQGFSFEELFVTIKKNIKAVEITDFYDKTFNRFFKNIRAVKKLDTDIYHITGGIGYYAIFLPSKATILTIHDTNHYEHDLKGLKKWIFGQLFYKLPFKNVAYLTTVSEHTKSRLISLFKFDPKKIKVIPNCYPSDFILSKKDRLNDVVKILQIGTKKNKNIERLVLAVKDFNIELTIIGKMSPELKYLLSENKINYLNKVNLSHREIYSEYLNCDIVSFISLHEGFGLPIIEANAIGRVVITSNISSMPEVAKESAHLVNPFKVEDIKNGIKKLIEDNDYRNRLIENGIENCKNYEPKKIASKYEELYQSILN